MDAHIFSAQAFALSLGNRAAATHLLGRSKPDGGGDTHVNLTPAQGEPTRTWAEVDAETQGADASRSGPHFHSDTGGLQGGADRDVGGGNRVGFALGYDRTTLRDSAGGSATGDTFRISGYASQILGSLGLSEVASYADAWSRTVRASGAGAASASLRSETLTLGAQAAAPFDTNGLRVTPIAGVLVSHVTSSSFHEADPVIAAFAVTGAGRSETFVAPYATVGISHQYATRGGVFLTPDAEIGYSYDPAARGEAFTLTASDGTVFRGNKVAAATGGALFGFSLTAHRAEWTGYVRYRAEVASNWSVQSGAVGFRLAF